MANSKNQKLKILFIYKYLSSTSSEEDALSTRQLIERLAKDNITAERKSVCNDIKTLSEFGIPIRNNKRRGYYILNSGMQNTESRILSEMVRSMQFISEENTEKMLDKLDNITPYAQAQRNLHGITDAKYIKTPNDSTLQTLDRIYYAIDNMLKISYQYGDRDYSKKLVFRQNGCPYTASPYSVLIHNNRCYMKCYLDKHDSLTYIRVDKMYNAVVLESPDHPYVQYAPKTDEQAQHGTNVFSGSVRNIHLSIEEKYISHLYDRFGQLIVTPDPQKPGWYTTVVHTVISPDFLSWIIKFFGKIKIAAPSNLVAEVQDKLALLITCIDAD